MRIAVIAPPWSQIPPVGYGGAELLASCVVEGYRDLGHEVTLYATSDSTLPGRRVPTLRHGEMYKAGELEAEEQHVRLAYREAQHHDFVHDWTRLGPVIGPSITTTPILATRKSLGDDPTADHGDNVHLVALSEAQRRSAPPDTFERVIHPGVGPARYPLGDGGGGFVVFLGRMTRDNGVAEALEATRQAGLPLKLAGPILTDEDEQFFDDIVRPARRSDTEYLGEIPFDEKTALLRDALALILPTPKPKAFPVAALEALASGTPVVGSDAGGLPELVSSPAIGLLGPSTDDLVTGLRAADGFDRTACRERVSEHFSASRMATDYVTTGARLAGVAS